MPSDRPFVFIGSSTEGLGIAKAIQANLDHSCESRIWSQGVFGLGSGTLEALVDQLNEYDFAILVLTPDDLVESRGQSHAAPRDNVLLELGMFLGALGRQRTFAVCDRAARVKLPSDLAGVTLADYAPPVRGDDQSAVGTACFQIEAAIKKFGKNPADAKQSQATASATQPSQSTLKRYEPKGVAMEILEMYRSFDTAELGEWTMKQNYAGSNIAVVDAIEELVNYGAIEYLAERVGGKMYKLTLQGRALILNVDRAELPTRQQSPRETAYEPAGGALDIMQVFSGMDKTKLAEDVIVSESHSSHVEVAHGLAELQEQHFLEWNSRAGNSSRFELTKLGQAFVVRLQSEAPEA